MEFGLVLHNSVAKHNYSASQKEIIRLSGPVLNGKAMDGLAGKIRFIIQDKREKVKLIILKMNFIKIADLSTVSVLEMLIYEVLINTKIQVRCDFNNKRKFDHSWNFIEDSIISTFRGKIDSKKYISDFENKVKVGNKSIRLIVGVSEFKSNEYLLSTIKSTIRKFIINFNYRRINLASLENESRILSMICQELIENALVHSDSDCYFKLQIEETYSAKDYSNHLVFSISSINLSSILASTLSSKYIVAKSRKLRFFPRKNIDMKLVKAFRNHKKYFNDKYRDKHFFMAANFQNGFTTKKNTPLTNGTGLAKLLEIINKRSTDKLQCYIMSGTTVLRLHDFIGTGKNSLVPFNRTGDFIKDKLDDSLLGIADYDFMGTIVQLTYTFRAEDKK